LPLLLLDQHLLAVLARKPWGWLLLVLLQADEAQTSRQTSQAVQLQQLLLLPLRQLARCCCCPQQHQTGLQAHLLLLLLPLLLLGQSRQHCLHLLLQVLLAGCPVGPACL
jgi:hypothetical protein